MKLGVQLPQVATYAGRDALLLTAQRAEDAGLDSVWVSDHLAFPDASMTPYPYSRDKSFPVPVDTPWLEAITAMAFTAAATSRVTIGVSVLVLPLRETLLLGKQLASIAALAPGRVVVGVGAGWLEEEFELLGVDFATRGAMLDEQLDALRELWTADRPTYQGAQVSFPPLIMEPHPTPPPEIWVGGTSGPALRRAGRVGDAWHAVGAIDPDELGRLRTTVARAARAAGRDPDRVALTVRIGSRPGKKGLASLRRRLEPFIAVGCTHAVVDPVVGTLDELLTFVDDLSGVIDGRT